ncbi:hypothetical protein ACFE04_018842 [Oxalis oulophora]
MDFYACNSPISGPQSGLQESMRHLGIGTDTDSYPDRPGLPDCVYYMRTGFCGYGTRCRYNHPRDRAAVEAAVRATGDYPYRPGELQCQFYLKTGTCKFGAACKFHHPKHAAGYLNNVPLNSSGYPLRPGEKECPYYFRKGQCKFGATCKFHHPELVSMTMSASAPQFYQTVQSPSARPTMAASAPQFYQTAQSPSARPPVLTGSYVQGAYGAVLFPPGVVPFPGWNPYSEPVSPSLSPGAQPQVGASSFYRVAQLSSSVSPLPGPYPSSSGPLVGSFATDKAFPERPGELECQYYLKTGDCKFGLSCRYHHPRDKVVPITNCPLSPIGLPLRPGVQACSFYLQNGHCKFGSKCKFDHPMGTMRYSPSASSLVDVPVVPYPPVGSLLATLLPSSSEIKNDSYISKVPSSVGMIFSQSVPLPFTNLQLSGQSAVDFGRSS